MRALDQLPESLDIVFPHHSVRVRGYVGRVALVRNTRYKPCACVRFHSRFKAKSWMCYKVSLRRASCYIYLQGISRDQSVFGFKFRVFFYFLSSGIFHSGYPFYWYAHQVITWYRVLRAKVLFRGQLRRWGLSRLDNYARVVELLLSCRSLNPVHYFGNRRELFTLHFWDRSIGHLNKFVPGTYESFIWAISY